MTPSHGARRGKRYRYYVSQLDDLQTSRIAAWRISANDIEQRLCVEVGCTIARQIDAAVGTGRLDTTSIELLQASQAAALELLSGPATSDLRALLLRLVKRVDVCEQSIRIEIDRSQFDYALADESSIMSQVAIASVRQGKQLKLVVLPAPTSSSSRKDPALIKLVVHALTLRERIVGRGEETFEELADAIGYSREHAADLLRVGYLAPDILNAILEGRQPAALSRSKLIRTPRLPLEWNEQRRVLGFA